MPYKNKEKKREYDKEYYLKNKERLRKYNKEWYEKNKERMREYSRNYVKEHREQHLNSEKARYERYRKLCKEKIGDKCFICGKNKEKIGRIVYHEINCEPHLQNPKYYIEHKDNFIPLCQNHHIILHSYMKYKDKFDELLKMCEDNK